VNVFEWLDDPDKTDDDLQDKEKTFLKKLDCNDLFCTFAA